MPDLPGTGPVIDDKVITLWSKDGLPSAMILGPRPYPGSIVR